VSETPSDNSSNRNSPPSASVFYSGEAGSTRNVSDFHKSHESVHFFICKLATATVLVY